MKKVVTLVLLLIPVIFCAAQKEQKKDLDPIANRPEWYDGNILLTDGTKLTGELKYNDQIGILSFRDDVENKSFTPRNVLSFNFFDGRTEKERYFYSLEYEDPEVKKVKRPLFFELIKDLGEFVVLLKADPIDFVEDVGRAHSDSFDPVTGTHHFHFANNNDTTTVIKQNETVYVMDGQGRIFPYLEIKYKNVKGYNGIIDHTSGTGYFADFEHKGAKGSFANKHLLEKYIGTSLYAELEKYAKENDLSFKRKGDLFKILDYYEDLLE